MPLQVDAAYKNGVLRPLQPLDLRELEHVVARGCCLWSNGILQRCGPERRDHQSSRAPSWPTRLSIDLVSSPKPGLLISVTGRKKFG